MRTKSEKCLPIKFESKLLERVKLENKIPNVSQLLGC